MSDFPLSGHVATGFEPVREAFIENFQTRDELGAGFAAWMGDELIIDLRGGWADRAQSRDWANDTLVPVYSTTKPISALIVAALIEAADGVTYETPVAEIWPEFATAGKDQVTIGEALSHQAGLPGFPDPIDPALWLDPPALSARLAEETPMWPPGTAQGYHPLTWGYLASEIARRLSGQSLGQSLSDLVTGTRAHRADAIDFHIGLPASEHDRTAELQRPRAFPELGELNDYKKAAFLTKWAAPDRGGAIWREIEIPSANGHGTAAATARLYGFYAHGGRLPSIDLLSRDGFDALTRSRTSGPDLVLPFDIDFAAGVMRNTQLVYGPNPASFGHSGWGGSMAFGDPAIGLSAAYVMNRQSNILQGDPRGRALIDALYACL